MKIIPICMPNLLKILFWPTCWLEWQDLAQSTNKTKTTKKKVKAKNQNWREHRKLNCSAIRVDPNTHDMITDKLLKFSISNYGLLLYYSFIWIWNFWVFLVCLWTFKWVGGPWVGDSECSVFIDELRTWI